MPFNATVTQNIVIDRTATGQNTTVSAGAVAKVSLSLGPAEAGTLTTRTNNTAGELTMDSADHGITTGSRLDLYWGDSNYRVGVTVGTVSGTAVPIASGGNGDVLPVVNTEVTAMVPSSEAVIVTGNNVEAIGLSIASGQGSGAVTFTQTDNTFIAVMYLDANGYVWYTGSGVDNPLDSSSVGKIYISSKDDVNTVVGAASLLYD